MKLTTIFSLLICFQISAKTYSQFITLSVHNKELGGVLKEIERQSGYSFFYKTELLQKADKVSVSVKNASLDDALARCFKNQPIDYSIVDHTIVLKPRKESKAIEPPKDIKAPIRGKVTGTDNKPLVGVTVLVKATRQGTTTDAEGAFLINAGKEDVLVVSYIGFNSKEMPVGNQTDFTIVLTESNTTLNEVAVIGYGTQSRKNLTSAISTVKPEELNRGAITDVGQLLQGKVPGLNITASGDPNRPAAVILRGVSTINSSQGPFYVIDGILGADIATVAPDDIATIDVLKDAAATAIYGNRAANGVIIITTKRGKKGQNVVSYSGYVGIENVSNNLKMMDATQLKDFLARNNVGLSPLDDQGANTDWQSAIQKSQAISTNHNLSFNGATDHTNYSASLNYANKDGILLNSSLKRLIARLAIEQYALNDKLKFGLTVSNSNTTSDDIPFRNTVLLQAAQYLPTSPVKNADGTYYENLGRTEYYNPVAMINNSQMNTQTNNLIGNFNTQVKLPFGFSYDLNLSYLSTTSLSGTYYNKYFTDHYNNMYDNPEPNLGFHTQQSFGTNGQATRSSYKNTTKILETFLTWNREFGDHSINAVIGYSWQNYIIGEGFQVTTSNLPVDNIGYNNLALSNPYGTSGFQIGFGADGIYQERRLISDFGRVNYNFRNKYLLQGSIRRDGSSVFGANNQWGYFPSVGAAWRISQESFMANQKLFNDLKLRASYGVTGNATGFGAYTTQFLSGSLGTYYYNGVLTSALGPTQAANPDLKWERTATANLGIDFTVLGGKVNGTVEVYNKNTTGMIYSYSVDPILVPTGKITTNGGSINNKGIEVSLGANILNQGNFKWTTSLNLAHNKNTVTSLSNPLFAGGDSVLLAYPEGVGQSSHSLEILKAGKPLGQFFSLLYAGKNSAGISQYVGGNEQLTTTPGIGVDYKYIGDAQPRLLVGWTNNFRYKNFDLNVFLRGTFGNKIFNATRADLFRPISAQNTNILADAANESISDVNSFLYSSRFVESGSYVRFDNATLGYTFKQLDQHIKNLRVYASVNNLFVITKYTGVDPEINQGGIAPGVDYNNFYPKTRTFLFGVNVSF
ncbi:TonB-dependent receptor [Spirosoma sp. KNUC1025]|uniref:TonB-dependent receptor n=1 Tax=Spirosoma sp. KNUC1025 TaxID=2894082 RepID=UPI00386C77E9|nr:TonB-dependent receptor [Spirosoma sp. KNUC1025]